MDESNFSKPSLERCVDIGVDHCENLLWPEVVQIDRFLDGNYVEIGLVEVFGNRGFLGIARSLCTDCVCHTGGDATRSRGRDLNTQRERPGLAGPGRTFGVDSSSNYTTP